MKALYCKKCKYLFNLDFKTKKCKCGKTKGKYINWHSAIYTGKDAVPLGIENPSFQKAINDIDKYKDEDFKGMTYVHSHFVSYTMVQSDLTFFKVENLEKYKKELNKYK